MSINKVRTNQKIRGFAKNPTTGQIQIIDKNNVTRPISFIGYNDIYCNATNKFGDQTVTGLGAYSNPAWTEYKLLGYGNHQDARYPNPVKANARRIYLNGVDVKTTVSAAPAVKDNGNVVAKDRKEFLFYIDALYDLNIGFTDVTLATINLTWTAGMTSANGASDTLKLNVYRPKLILEGGNGQAFERGGRAVFIEASNNQFPELLSNSTAGISVVINSNGSGLTVGGVAQTSYTIPAGKLKVANWAAQTYQLTNTGSTLRVTGKNQGMFMNYNSVADYEYIQYNGGYPNDKTTENMDGGVIIARPASEQLRLNFTNSALEYYNNGNVNFTTNNYNAIADIHCIVPSQYVAGDPETMNIGFYAARPIDFVAKGIYSDAYYDYDYEKEFGNEKVLGAKVNYISDSQLKLQVKTAQKYGVWTFINAFWNFQNFDYSIYGGTPAEQKIIKIRKTQDYIDTIMQKVALVIDEVGYCMLILGNESNLDQNLRGELNGSYIFFADQTNQDKQANVNAMMKFFNVIAGQLHAVYGNKVIVGPSLQLGGQGQCDEIIASMNAGFASNFDCLFNNYYSYSDPANPNMSVENFDALAYYKANRGTSKLPIILSECGIGSRSIDINNVPAGYDKYNGTKGFVPSTPVVYTNIEANQALIGRNLITKFLKNPAYNDVCQGLLYFGDFDQPHRSSLTAGYGAAIYGSFMVPPTNFVSIADHRANIDAFVANPTTAVIPAGKVFIFEEKASGQLWRNTPRDFDPAGDDYQATAFMPTLAQLQTAELPVMAAVRAEIALGVPGLIYTNEI